MKILHLSKKYPSALGGDAVVVANLQKQQRKGGHAVVVATSNCNEISSGAHIYKIGFKDTSTRLDVITLKRIASLLVLFFKMFTILRKERPDIIHTHSIDMAFFASFAARFYRIPMVHTFHIVTFYDANQSALRRKTEIWLAKNAGLRYVTAPNNYDVKKLQSAGLDQAVLLPNGVDLTFWKPDNHPEAPEIFEFVAIGRLEHQKGYEYLIKAVSFLAQTLPAPFRVTIIGDGSQGQALRELASSMHTEDLIRFAGPKTQKQVHILLAKADAAIFPSLYETTPITMLEAWSAAVPVIITSVGIMRDAPADFDAAYIVPPKDEHALAQAMSQCMVGAAKRQAIAAKGHQEVKQYAWPIIARTAEQMYKRSTL